MTDLSQSKLTSQQEALFERLCAAVTAIYPEDPTRVEMQWERDTGRVYAIGIRDDDGYRPFDDPIPI